MSKQKKQTKIQSTKKMLKNGEPLTLGIKMVIVDSTDDYDVAVWFDEHYIEHRYKIIPIKSEDAGS